MKGKTLLLTGIPGIGKTTVMRKVAAGIQGRVVRGFLTDEIRDARGRIGFCIETFDGSSATLAHVDIHSKARVGRYGVDLASLDRAVESALQPAEATLYLIDEIGKMECFSTKFMAAVKRLFESGQEVVATVAMKGGGFIEEVKRRRETEIWEVTRANRDDIPKKVVSWLAEHRE